MSPRNQQGGVETVSNVAFEVASKNRNSKRRNRRNHYESSGCSYSAIGGLAVGVLRKAALMRSTISQAEQEAMSAQAFHVGESSAAFQASHARFVEAAARVNTLLDIAQANLGRRRRHVCGRRRRRSVDLHRILIRPITHERTCDVADYVQLPGDAGPRRGHVGLRRHVAGAGRRYRQRAGRAVQCAGKATPGMTYQVWQAQWNQAMEAAGAGLPVDGQHPRIQHAWRCTPATPPKPPNGAVTS